MIIRRRSKTIAEKYAERQAKEDELKKKQLHRGKTLEEMTPSERRKVIELKQRISEDNKRRMKTLGISFKGNLELSEKEAAMLK